MVEEGYEPVTAMVVVLLAWTLLDGLAREDVMAAEWDEKDRTWILEQETTQTQVRAGCRWGRDGGSDSGPDEVDGCGESSLCRQLGPTPAGMGGPEGE